MASKYTNLIESGWKVSHRLIEDLASEQDMSEVASTTPPDELEPRGEVGGVQEAADACRRHEDLQGQDEVKMGKWK